MLDYCHIEDGSIDDGPRSLPRSWRNVSGLYLATPEELKDKGWLPVVYVNDAYDTATQVRTGPVGCNVGDVITQGVDSVTGTYTVRDKTAQELTGEQQTQDLANLREAGRDIALVLTELVDWTLANTSMQPTDFSPIVKQAYQDLKVIADRVKT